MNRGQKLVSWILCGCMVFTCCANVPTQAKEDVMMTEATPYEVQAATDPTGLDQYAYDGNDLGATYTKEQTTFRVWAPTASSVSLKRYKPGRDSEAGAGDLGTTEMTKLTDTDGSWTNGVWTATITGDLKNTYYTYMITTDGTTRETVDLYAKAVGVNGDRGMVVDLADTNPAGWEEDTHQTVEHPTDAIIWETHIKDFSSDPDSGVSEQNRGKYKAFTETDTTLRGEGKIATCVNHLKELGVNYVHLLPSFDFDNDETQDKYNWGYNPKNYNVPEGMYSSNPYDGKARIEEFKEMVQALHAQGIGVILDVVYNHTSKTEDSWFNVTVPDYYYRKTADGQFSNGSGCGNETASERAMCRKYIVDSVTYWAQEYHIDGFRFDLMGVHDVDTMNEVRSALDALLNGKQLIVYGEPWTGGTTSQPEGVNMAVKDNMSLLDSRIAAFNDDIRDATKGYVFENAGTGFVQGGCGDTTNSKAFYDVNLQDGIVANTDRASQTSWAKQPSQTISYVSAHDNLTLYDKLVCSVKGDGSYQTRDENLVQMNKLAAAAILTSQGTSFFQSGEEFARTKGGNDNSYESDISINQLDWSRLTEYADLNAYYQGMIQIREHFTPFRDPENTSADTIAFSQDTTENLIAYTIENQIDPDCDWQTVAVLLNSNDQPQTVMLKTASGRLPETWNVVAGQEQAGLQSLGEVSGSTVTVPARTAMVLVDEKDASDDSAGQDSQKEETSVQSPAASSPTTGDRSVAPAAFAVSAGLTGGVLARKKRGRRRKDA